MKKSTGARDVFSTHVPMGDGMIDSPLQPGKGKAEVSARLSARRHHPDIGPGKAARDGKGMYPQGKDADL